MASSLETNKLLAAILTAGVIASGAGVLSRILYSPSAPEEPAYVIAVVEGGGEAAEGEAEAVPIGVLLASADPAAGEGVAKKCTACHSFDEGGANQIGPALHGVVGREIAAVGGFDYSEALASMEGGWDYEALNGFLLNPKGWAPGTKMAFAGLKKDQDRADLIAYLRDISPDAPPLPEPEATEAAEGEQPAEGGEEQQAAAEGEPAAEGGEEQQVAAREAEPEQAADGETDGAGAGAEAEGTVALIASADPAAGEKAARVCTACHSFEQGGPNKIGPPLYGVVGRDVAALDDYKYSSALAELGGSWDYAALDGYLADPRGYAPGNKMTFAGVKKEDDRAAIIAYLRSLSDDPPPLPGG